MIGMNGGDASMLMTDEWVTIIEHAEELTEILLSSEVVDELS